MGHSNNFMYPSVAVLLTKTTATENEVALSYH